MRDDKHKDKRVCLKLIVAHPLRQKEYKAVKNVLSCYFISIRLTSEQESEVTFTM